MAFLEFVASLTFKDWIILASFVLGIGNLTWTLYRDGWRDRAKLRVSVTEATAHNAPDEDRPLEIVIIAAVNVGRRTVIVDNWLYKKKGEKHLCWLVPNWDHPLSERFDKVPKELKEGQMFQTFILVDTWDDYPRRSSIKWFAVTDTLNRSWKSKKYPLRERKTT